MKTAPWAWNRGWWAGYPELQFYPPGAAYLGALVAWPTRGVLSLETAYVSVLWLTYLLPGVTTYLVVARLVGSGWPALPRRLGAGPHEPPSSCVFGAWLSDATPGPCICTRSPSGTIVRTSGRRPDLAVVASTPGCRASRRSRSS